MLKVIVSFSLDDELMLIVDLSKGGRSELASALEEVRVFHLHFGIPIIRSGSVQKRNQWMDSWFGLNVENRTHFTSLSRPIIK